MVMVSQSWSPVVLSVTQMVTDQSRPPWLSAGVHRNVPPDVIEAPGGTGPDSENVGSPPLDITAVAAKVRRTCSCAVLLPIGFRTGGDVHPVLIVIVSESLSIGEPLSS